MDLIVNKLHSLAIPIGLLLQFGPLLHSVHCDASGEFKSSDPVAQTPKPGTLPGALLSLSTETKAFSRYAFLVDKAERTLTVWENEGTKIKLVGAFPADIGAQAGDKAHEGDYKTPEGIYFFQQSLDGQAVDFSQYGKRIFTMDYPNYFDRLEHKTGKGIWLHAIPDKKSLLRGSRGCVVVRNNVIEALAQFVELKRTPIVVVNQVEYMSEEEWLRQQSQFRAWLDDWRLSWGTKNIEKYMAQYSDKFQSLGMNKDQWRTYKQNLNERYKFIDISLKDVQIFNQGSKVVLRFLQEYQSDQKQDRGAKIIYALRSPEKWEIVGENWQPLE